MNARLSNGNWYIEPLRPPDVNTHTHPPNGFTEGSEWTYLFGALHDPEGMIELFGGRENFISLLDENFESGHYRHDNEPGHHYIYLYNYSQGSPAGDQESRACKNS